MPSHNYRLAVDEHGNHGYEIGYWTDQVPEGEQPIYIVQAKCYDQQEAQRLATAFDTAPPPDHLPPQEGGNGEAPTATEAHHVRSARARK